MPLRPLSPLPARRPRLPPAKARLAATRSPVPLDLSAAGEPFGIREIEAADLLLLAVG